MKKLFILFALGLVMNVSFAQPVSDNAVIPISVTLQSILRLNVTSGGNIEFIVNTISAYNAGINNAVGTATRYDTQFTVASSIDFDIDLYSESATLINVDNAANTMLLNNLLYAMEYSGVGGVVATNWSLQPAAGAFAALTNAAFEVVSSIPVVAGVGGGAGDAAKNKFTINWELCGTNRVGNTLLQQSIPSGRYSTNVFLVLRQHN